MTFVASYFAAAAANEKKGDLAAALTEMLNAEKDLSRARIAGVVRSNIDRLLETSRRRARKLMSEMSIEALYEGKKNPRSYATDVRSAAHMPPIIALTTISARIDRVDKTIATISAQSLQPHSINLFLSEQPFLLDKGVPDDHPALARLADNGVNVYQVPNLGPYRKQIPLIKMLWDSGAPTDTMFVTIDDDVLYPPKALEMLIDSACAESCIVAHRGRQMKFEQCGEPSGYHTWAIPKADRSMRNLGTGKNGIAYRLGYFPREHDDFVGPVLAPTADDIWCKWVTTLNCIPTLILDPKAAHGGEHDFVESAPDDKRALWHSYNAKGTNDAAINNLERYFSRLRGSAAAIMRDSRA